MSSRFAALVLLAALPAAAQTPPSLRAQLLAIEDTRAQGANDEATLRQSLTDRNPQVRRQAVRAIGRLERPELIPSLTRALGDDNVDVRLEAANAVGQLARTPQSVSAAATRLLARVRAEVDPRVWGVVAATLGRLPYSAAADVDAAEAAIARVLPGANATAIQIDAVLGAVEGLEALARQSGRISRLKASTLSGLRAASALEGRAQDAAKLARIRRLATLALVASGGATRQDLERGLASADDEVRRLTMVAARAEIEGREAVVTTGLRDSHQRVRFEALQTWGRLFQKTSCEPIVTAIRDPNPHVRLLAIDLLGNGCPATGIAPASTLQALAEGLTVNAGGWHVPAHALVSLAKTAPAEARKLLARYIAHDTWQVRMYAARAAGALAALDELDRLGRDPHHNVREAALSELLALKRPEAARLALDGLTKADYQLVMTSARALAGHANRGEATAALVTALARITAEKKQTSRDARVAILERLKELGPPADPAAAAAANAAFQPLFAENDAAIRAKVAEVSGAWAIAAAPVVSVEPIEGAAIDLAALDALAETRLRFVIRGRGSFDMRLFVDEAPVTAAHVTQLARQGYYNGLTFHRVAPNFVIQGGGPGANEYAGQGAYMRDEVGLRSHQRGTVGISTRGRDTGDAQIFVNLVDSPRLDHTYTVFAEVTAGMDVVDDVLEGDVIERVEVLPPSRR
jgi:cyclophilin family peptidyl-prolyl cis-trans isomerase/HEAT repeat protein